MTIAGNYCSNTNRRLYIWSIKLVLRAREVGPWTLEKLTLLRDYLTAYVKATKTARKISYVDLFAGPGQDKLKDKSQVFDGSPLIAMKLRPGFTRFIFVESDSPNTGSLQTWISKLGRSREADVVYGDCNQRIDEIVDKIPKDGPCFVFLDPSSPSLNWATVARIASIRVGYRKRRPEQLILFPYNMGIARMLPRNEDPVSIRRPDEEQINNVMPDASKWKKVIEAWRNREIEAQEKQRRFLYLYWMGLTKLGYEYVLSPRLIRTPDKHPLYHLFFASDHYAGRNIMESVFEPKNMFDQQLPLIQENSFKFEDPFKFKEGEEWYLELESGRTDTN